MELPLIVFALLFVLVIILILLHLSNRKYADKISILEQALNVKIEALPTLKQTYTDAKKAIEQHASQESEIVRQTQDIVDLENTLKILQENQNDISLENIEDREPIDIDAMKTLNEEKKENARHESKIKTLETRIDVLGREKKALEETIDNFKHKVLTLENELELHKDSEKHSANREYNEVIAAIHQGDDMQRIAKAFGIPMKHIELIAKFDKMQREK